MNSLSRMLGLSLVLLVVFLAAALAAQWWLNRETRRMQTEAVAAKRAQFAAILRFDGRAPAEWDDAYAQRLSELIGGTVLFRGPGEAVPRLEIAGALSFDHVPDGGSGRAARVYFPLSGMTRLTALHHRLLLAITLLALVLLIVPAFALLSRQPASGGTRAPWPSPGADMRGLEHFARISVERGDRLAREFEARQRAEEDLQLSRTQLGRSLEERIRLGRELHDNISQTLYGLSLTLESALKRLEPSAPPEVRQRLELSVQELRRLNQEVRQFIRELEPAQVQRQPMVAALDALVATLPLDSGLRLERKIDEEVLGRVPPERSAEIVNILREAISNSLRHGGATALTLHAQRGEGTVVFGVQDDGRGFDQADTREGGRGLANMRARAEALGGEIRVVSAPGKGTRILLTLPVASPA